MVDCRIELVLVPVADVDRSRAFYGDTLGWPVDHDQTVSEEIRFVQVTPPGSACHADLSARGVQVSAVTDLAWGRFVSFSDPDGTPWAVQQLPPR